jgi:hypothetical protein
MRLPALFLLGCAFTSLGCDIVIGIPDGEPKVVALPSTCVGTLRIRITNDTMGPARDVSPSYVTGITDYMRNLNAVSGGIRGCQIDVGITDVVGSVTATRSAVEGFKAKPDEWAEVSTLFIFGAEPAAGLAQELADEQKLLIPGSYAGRFASPTSVVRQVSVTTVNASDMPVSNDLTITSTAYPYVFFAGTDSSTAIRIAMNHAGDLLENSKIAMVFDPDCVECSDPVTAGRTYYDQAELVPGRDLIGVPQTPLENDYDEIEAAVTAYFAEEITKKEANSSYVPTSWLWVGHGPTAAALVGRAVGVAQADINGSTLPKEDQWTIRIMTGLWGLNERTNEICGSACNGIFYGVVPAPLFADDQRASRIAELQEVHASYRGIDGDPLELHKNVNYVMGYAAAAMWHKAVEFAVDSGVSTPTGADLKTALEGAGSIDLGGLSIGQVSFDADDHRPQANVHVYQIADDGELFVANGSVNMLDQWLGY